MNNSLDIKQEELISKNGSYVSGYKPYVKIQNNEIKLTGIINGQINQVLYIIPDGYRPSKKCCFICPSSNGSQSTHFAIVEITSSGEISFSYVGGQNICLNNISYFVE